MLQQKKRAEVLGGGCWLWLKRWFAWGFFLLLGLALVGFLIETIMTEQDARRFPGKRFDIGGYSLHIYCQGEGQPTVLLESGMGESSLTWLPIQSEIARTTQVCVYDRAGAGWSDPVPLPRDASQITEELHRLLEKAQIEGPYVLVGHSLGGIYSRLYVDRYPDGIVGMVLIDASHEDQLQRMPQSNSQAQAAQAKMIAGLARIGVIRLFGSWLLHTLPEDALPQGIEPYLTISYSPKALNNAISEHQYKADSFQQVRTTRAVDEQWHFPLLILTSLKDEQGRESWQALQTDLLQLSADSRQIITYQSGHYIHYTEPDLVIKAIQEIVQKTHSNR